MKKLKIRIVIEGPQGSGKSQLADALAECLVDWGIKSAVDDDDRCYDQNGPLRGHAQIKTKQS